MNIEHTEFYQKAKGLIPRLTQKTFQFDPRIQDDFFSAKYFTKTSAIMSAHFQNNPENRNTILMQFFQRHDAILCGIDEVIALINQCAHQPKTLQIFALQDGDKISPFEPVLTIEGHYENFGFLEGIIDGILARRSSIATNTYELLTAVKGATKPAEIIFMGDRDDDYLNQMGDGYASKIGGINKHATDAMCAWFGGVGVGTMPHALIQGFGGDVLAASQAYLKYFPDDALIALVDYNNDVIGDSLLLAEALGSKLQGVRVDTSPMLIDQYFMNHPELLGQFDPRGVNPVLIKALRRALDQAGFQQVKIVVSGGFDLTKLKYFIDKDTPVDVYGVGASLLKVNIGFTGDCVLLNQQPCAKAGRKFIHNPRLAKVTF